MAKTKKRMLAVPEEQAGKPVDVEAFCDAFARALIAEVSNGATSALCTTDGIDGILIP